MRNSDQKLHDLARELARKLESHDSGCARELAAALREEELTATRAAAGEAADNLARAIEGTGDGLSPALTLAAPHLAWHEGGFGKTRDRGRITLLVSQLLNRTGADGIGNVKLGLLLIAPQYAYPIHSHAAEELYLVLSGGLDWRVDGKEIGPKSAGDFVHHSPWQRHAMTTGADPALLFWGWTGDTRSETYRMH